MEKALTFLLGCLWLLPACVPSGPPGMDIEPPTVMGVEPTGAQVDPDRLVVVDFSEPVDLSVVDEQLVVLVADESLDDEFLTDFDRPPLAAKRAELALPGWLEAEEHGARVVFEAEGPFEAGKVYWVVVSAAVRDLAGNPLVADLQTDENGRSIGTQTHVLHRFAVLGRDEGVDDPPASLGRLILSEVLANPVGEEAEGEYVELYNPSDESIDLSGWLLSDTGEAGQGDVLSSCEEGQSMALQAGGVALLVGQSFVPPADMPAGTMLVCGGRTGVTPRGLKNGGGEILVLSDSTGREVDRYGGWVNLTSREGCAAVRLDLEAPDGPDNWAVPEGDGCRSPGWVGP